ncbi:MAG: GIY-YIG nuclease family protein [Candidatus Moraniibacteriota bacterium]
MRLDDLKNKKLPDSPGIYFFLDSRKNILYIGRATSLRNRVRSYFVSDIHEKRGAAIKEMVEKSEDLEFEKTDSVLEAIILEAEMIKKYRPPYNVKEKDDKSFNFLVITKEDFPRVLVVRGRNLEKNFSEKNIKYKFGPFPQGALLREAVKIVRKIFTFRDKCIPFQELKDKKNAKPCFNCQINLCPGVCSGEIDKKEYNKIIQHIRLFFQGRKKALIRDLKKEMDEYVKNQEFEKAEKVKKTIFALNHIADVSLMKSESDHKGEDFCIEGYDISHLSGTEAVGVMVSIKNTLPDKDMYRRFKIRSSNPGDDGACLCEVLERRLRHQEWIFPDLIVVDGGTIQRNAALFVLEKFDLNIPVVGVVKDDRHKPKEIIGDLRIKEKHKKEILLANFEAHRFAIEFQRKRRE